MFVNRFQEFKRFLSLYKIEEHIYHRACNNFEHLFLKSNEKIELKDKQSKDFFLIASGKIKANYEKDYKLNEYENNFTKKRNKKKIQLLNEEIYMERIISSGEYFGENIKYKGYILRSFEVIDDLNLIFLTESIFGKIFSFNMNKFDKQKRTFILKNISTLCEMSFSRYEVFLKQLDTMVNLLDFI